MVTIAGWSSFATASASFWIHSSDTGCFSAPVQGLERNDAPELRIGRLVHRAEAAPADLAPDLVATDEVAWLEWLAPGRGEVLLRRPRDLHEQPRDGARLRALSRVACGVDHERPPVEVDATPPVKGFSMQPG